MDIHKVYFKFTSAMDTTHTKLSQLFEAIPPRDLRKLLQELYFRYQMNVEHADNIPELTEAVYFLLKFLDEMEEGEYSSGNS